MKSLLSCAYWPNLEYFYYVLHSEKICIELNENYQKQSFRNRCQILSANGPLNLSIPVKHLAQKELSKEIEISYKENWQVKHWRAIISAYKNSPYFEHFEDEIKSLYNLQPKLLLDYNTLQLQALFKLLRIKKDIHFSINYQVKPFEYIDRRESIHPKIDFRKNEETKKILLRPYYQTFEAKLDFVPNLSVLDLLFNKGLEMLEYLEYSKPNNKTLFL